MADKHRSNTHALLCGLCPPPRLPQSPFLHSPTSTFVGIQAYIYARGQSYGATDWQRCLIVPNIGNLQ
jgi:hypothetical protein